MIPTRIFTSAIAAGPFSRSAKTARFLFSPPSKPSVSAYHLAFGPNGDLFVTGPTTSSFDSVHKIDSHGSVSTFYRGLGRPQGLAFDIDGNLYVAASLSGKRGIVKITPDAKASLEVAGPGTGGSGLRTGQVRRAGYHRRRASSFVGSAGIAAGAGVGLSISSSAFSFVSSSATLRLGSRLTSDD